jgi:hypothetical protein
LVQALKIDREDTETNKQRGDHISLLLFYKNKESKLIKMRTECSAIITVIFTSTNGNITGKRH